MTRLLFALALVAVGAPALAQECPRVTYGGSPYHVDLMGPATQRCRLEQTARAQYRELTDEDRALARPDQMLVQVRTGAPYVVPYAGLRVPAPVVRVVLRQGATIVQPLEVTRVEQTWGNTAGATVTTAGADVWLPWDQVPAGDFDLIVVYEGGDQSWTVKGKKRRTLQ